MVDALKTSPGGADTWRAEPGRHSATENPHVAYRQIGPSGQTRLKLDSEGFLGRPAPEVRNGSGIRQVGPGFGEARPISAESFHQAPQITIFEAPPGEQRI